MRRCAIAFSAVVVLLSLSSISRAGTFVVATEADQVRLMLELRAQQFLNRATFGATDAEISTLASAMARDGITAACSNWVDAQFAVPRTSHLTTIQQFMTADSVTSNIDPTQNMTRFRHHAFWHNAIAAPDQLKQRLAWALLQICVIGDGGNDFNFVEIPTGQPTKPFWWGVSSYYDMLLDNCDDTYRDVLQGVTYHPIMGIWLSSLRNPKGDAVKGTFPDENYAREIMQLFSIGLNELNIDGTYKRDAEQKPIPTYDNETIKEFAKVFTGLNYATGNGTSITSGDRNYLDPMIMTESAHDRTAKVLFNNYSTPANTNGNIDIGLGLDNLYAHPNVGPFISRLLIQRFVRSNPSKGYIQRVATVFNNNGSGVKGDLKAVVKAILIDNEAWSSITMTRLSNPTRLVVSSNGTEFGRLIEPVVQYAGFFRRYGIPPSETGGRYFLNATPGTWNQAPFRSPSVFNFYLPHFQPAGGLATATGSQDIPNGDLFAPEFQILTAVTANAWQNRSRSDVIDKSITQSFGTTPAKSLVLRFNFDKEETLGASTAGPKVIVEHLDKVLCNGVMTDDFRTRLVTAMSRYVPQTRGNVNRGRDNSRGAMITVMDSPFYLIRY